MRPGLKKKRRVDTHHSGELSISTVGTGLAVSSETRDLGEVETELGLEPVNGVTRASSEDFNEIVTSEIASLVLRSMKRDHKFF